MCLLLFMLDSNSRSKIFKLETRHPKLLNKVYMPKNDFCTISYELAVGSLCNLRTRAPTLGDRKFILQNGFNWE